MKKNVNMIIMVSFKLKVVVYSIPIVCYFNRYYYKNRKKILFNSCNIL